MQSRLHNICHCSHISSPSTLPPLSFPVCKGFEKVLLLEESSGLKRCTSIIQFPCCRLYTLHWDSCLSAWLHMQTAQSICQCGDMIAAETDGVEACRLVWSEGGNEDIFSSCLRLIYTSESKCYQSYAVEVCVSCVALWLMHTTPKIYLHLGWRKTARCGTGLFESFAILPPWSCSQIPTHCKDNVEPPKGRRVKEVHVVLSYCIMSFLPCSICRLDPSVHTPHPQRDPNGNKPYGCFVLSWHFLLREHSQSWQSRCLLFKMKVSNKTNKLIKYIHLCHSSSQN